MEISAAARTELVALFEEVAFGDPTTISDPAVSGRRIAGCQRFASFFAAAEAELLPIHQRLLAEAERAAAAEAAAQSGGDTPSDAASDAAEEPPVEPMPAPRESARVRQLRVVRSKWLEFYPALAAALTAGTITAEHVDALAAIFERTPPTIIAHLTEQQLVSWARTYPPEGFGSFIRDEIARIRDDGGEAEYQRQLDDSYAWMGIDKSTGMYLLKVAIDPLRGPQLQSAVDQRITWLRNQPGNDRLRWGQLCLQAIWDLLMEGVTITPDSIVVVDQQTATTARQHLNTVCQNIDGIPVPVSAAVQACAIGNITAAIINSSGKVIDYGCNSALADRKQRFLQRAMYTGCAHPDCDQPYTRCEIHHVIYRQHGGKTVMSNLVPLCVRHHHQLHDEHWTLTMDDGRTLRWYRPDGAPAHTTTLTRLDGLDAAGAADAAAATGPPGMSSDDPRETTTATGPPGDDPPQLFEPRAA